METDEEVALSPSVRHSSNRTPYAGPGDRTERLPGLGFFFLLSLLLLPSLGQAA